MYKVILSIGSNTNALFNLNQAINKLQECFNDVKFTPIIQSKAFGEIYKSPFINTLGYFKTALPKNELTFLFKSIEKEMGRSLEHKNQGKVIIDIDLIKWDNEIVKPEDFKRNYVQDLLQFVEE